ncbi:uncharacterized protein LOC123513898 [Portunus trituberculatus]|uniref:uncharacterized protein LOC123513898 n=1 Tax=Portunus trituberculatus TaxID=210409 RepID=UPI001E1D05BC|nr:uncharacterized protein LOC123513898 [Portunus trituberculatus]
MDGKDIQKVKDARTVAKRTFTRKCKLFDEAVTRRDANVVLSDICAEVCDVFTKVERCHEEYVSILVKNGEEESVIAEAEQYIDELERRKLDLVATERKLCSGKDPDKDGLLKVKSIQPPVFNGEIRTYPTFKEDYKRLMESSFRKDPYALRSCLSGAALDAVQGVENDYDKMFNRLDEKFGDNCKLVDTLLCDLKSTKPINEGDIKGFVRMVEKFERCWLDMRRMNLEREMNTVNMVSFVERIMPGTQRREWVIWSEKYRNSTDLFERLMEFLLREKRVLEYMDSSVRCNASNKICHNAISQVDKEGSDGGMTSIIKKLQEDQNEMKQCLNQLTQSIRDLGLGKGDSEQSQYQGIKCWLHDSYSHSIHNCNEFVGMSNSDKVEVVKRNRICFSCLKGSHMSKKCWSKRPCNIVSDGQRCGKDHHPLLHEAYIEGLMFHMTLTGKLESRVRDRTLLMMNKLYSTNCSTPLNTLWDPGSDITLVRFDAASRLGLTGKEVTLSVTKVGGRTERLHSREYIIPLKDLDGKIWRITAYGIESITSTVCKVDLTEVTKLFEGVSVTDLDMPEGDIDLLIGTDWCNLMPEVISSVGTLQLMRSMFGYCIRGSHPLIKFHKPGSNVFGVRISHIACSRNLSELREEDNFKLKMNLEKFFEIEGLGTYCVPKCGGCKCGSCTPGDKNYNLKERESWH